MLTATIARAAADDAGLEPRTASLIGVTDAEDLPVAERDAEKLYGRWTVVASVGGADDAPERSTYGSMIGKTFSYSEEGLGWLGSAGELEPKDRCPSPVFQILEPASTARANAKAYKPAWAGFRLPAGEVGALHTWLCDVADDTGLGPGAGTTFIPVGEDRMVMGWYDGAILLLQRANS